MADEMTMTGFTLEIDGEPKSIERLMDAITSEWSKILDELWRADSEIPLAGGGVYHPRPSPVHGTLSIRKRLG